MAYTISWRVRDVTLTGASLRVWEKDRVRAEAEALVDTAMETCRSPAVHTIGPLLGQELRDWVLRGGERFMPLPDHVLDAYWRAARGLSGFYDPLLLGVAAKAYLGLGSAGDIGEGVALAVVETAAPDGLGHVAICRPLGSAPDFICQEPNDPTRRPLVEVKSTEKATDVRRGLVDGVHTLLDIYRAWQRHRPLAKTPGLAVSVFLGQERFDVEIVRLVFTGEDLVGLRAGEFVDLDQLAVAKKAVWASMYEDAAMALSGVLWQKSGEMIENELSALVALRSSVVSAVSARDRLRPPLPKGKGKKGVKEERERAIVDGLERMGIDVESHELQNATSVVMATETQRGEDDPSAQAWRELDWSRTESVLGWAVSVQPRADGVELRAYRGGRGNTARHVVADALAALEHRDHGKRYRRGHAAVAAWIGGVEWTGFCDGRLQGWIPEVEHGPSEAERMLADAGLVIQRWERLRERA